MAEPVTPSCALSTPYTRLARTSSDKNQHATVVNWQQLHCYKILFYIDDVWNGKGFSCVKIEDLATSQYILIEWSSTTRTFLLCQKMAENGFWTLLVLTIWPRENITVTVVINLSLYNFWLYGSSSFG